MLLLFRINQLSLFLESRSTGVMRWSGFPTTRDCSKLLLVMQSPTESGAALVKQKGPPLFLRNWRVLQDGMGRQCGSGMSKC